MKPVLWRQKEPLSLWSSDVDPWIDELFKPRASFLPEFLRRTPMPAVNLAESPSEFVATIELPGLDEKDIDVQLVGHQLVITGERKWEDEKRSKEFYSVETQYGAFKRALPLPEGLNLDVDAVTAKLQKGMLTVRIPKVEPKAASKVRVDVLK
jgi:HSP20 family protein